MGEIEALLLQREKLRAERDRAKSPPRNQKYAAASKAILDINLRLAALQAQEDGPKGR